MREGGGNQDKQDLLGTALSTSECQWTSSRQNNVSSFHVVKKLEWVSRISVCRLRQLKSPLTMLTWTRQTQSSVAKSIANLSRSGRHIAAGPRYLSSAEQIRIPLSSFFTTTNKFPICRVSQIEGRRGEGNGHKEPAATRVIEISRV